MSLLRRKYESYDSYLGHQAAKLPRLMSSGWGAGFRARRQAFTSRFREFLPFIRGSSSVLCLGARTGEEVAAFTDLGFCAVGVDINPGKNNRLVIQADFHSLPFNDRAFDLAYSNSLDHAWDLTAVARECGRVLRSPGDLIVELGIAFDQLNRGRHLRRQNTYESLLWDDDDDLLESLEGFSSVVRFKNPAADYRTIIMRWAA